MLFRSELGVRRALGANGGDVLATVLDQTIRPAAAGIVLGLPLAWLLASQLRSVLYEIGPAQPSAWLLAVLSLALVAAAAAALPARRATRVEPLVALRHD